MSLNKFMLFCKEYHINDIMLKYVSNYNSLAGNESEDGENGNSHNNEVNMSINIYGVGQVGANSNLPNIEQN